MSEQCIGMMLDGEPIILLEIKCPRCDSPQAQPLNRRTVFVDYRCLQCGWEYLIDEMEKG